MSLISELQRRKVFRAALIYAVGAWGVLQAVDVLSALAGLPDWTLRAVLVVLVVLFPFAMLFSWAFRISAFRIRREEGRPLTATFPAADSEGLLQAGAGDQSPVAVVPFRNLSGEAHNNYLADGLTHEVLGRLAGVGALRVPERHSVCCDAEGRADLRGVAATLPVSHVLQGSVQRIDDSLKVDAELLDVFSGERTWSEAHDGLTGDLVRIAAELAESAAESLGVPLADARRKKRRPGFGKEANIAYLKGRHALNRATAAGSFEAIEHFEVALAAAPTMARAHAGIANAYWWLASYGGLSPDHGYPRARDAAERALAHEPDLADAHLALAQVRLRYDWNFAAAEESFQQALRSDPSSAEVHELYGHFLQMMGKHDEAVAMRRKAVRLDPLSRSAHRGLADSAFCAGALDEAVRELETIAQYSPDYPIHHLKARIELRRGRPREALDLIRHDAMNWRRLYISAIAHYQLGDSDSHREALKELMNSHGDDAGLQIAIVYAQAGDRDKAFEWLERAFQQRDPGLIELESDPELEPLRDDPRFRSLQDRIGFR